MASEPSASKTKARRYSIRFTEYDLSRTEHIAILSIMSVMMLLTVLTVIVDYLKPATWLLDAETFMVNDAIDAGTISNIRHGKFAWPVTLIALIIATLLIVDLLSLHSVCILLFASALLLAVPVFCLGFCIKLKASEREPKFSGEDDSRLTPFARPNLLVSFIAFISVYLSYVYNFYQLNKVFSKNYNFSDQQTPNGDSPKSPNANKSVGSGNLVPAAKTMAEYATIVAVPPTVAQKL